MQDKTCVSIAHWLPAARPVDKALGHPAMRSGLMPAQPAAEVTPAVVVAALQVTDVVMDAAGAAPPSKQRRCEEDPMPSLGLTPVENAGNGDCLFLALADAFKWMGIGGATAQDVRARKVSLMRIVKISMNMVKIR